MKRTELIKGVKIINRLMACNEMSKEHAIKIKALVDELTGEKKPSKKKAVDSGE